MSNSFEQLANTPVGKELLDVMRRLSKADHQKPSEVLVCIYVGSRLDIDGSAGIANAVTVLQRGNSDIWSIFDYVLNRVGERCGPNLMVSVYKYSIVWHQFGKRLMELPVESMTNGTAAPHLDAIQQILHATLQDIETVAYTNQPNNQPNNNQHTNLKRN